MRKSLIATIVPSAIILLGLSGFAIGQNLGTPLASTGGGTAIRLTPAAAPSVATVPTQVAENR